MLSSTRRSVVCSEERRSSIGGYHLKSNAREESGGVVVTETSEGHSVLKSMEVISISGTHSVSETWSFEVSNTMGPEVPTTSSGNAGALSTLAGSHADSEESSAPVEREAGSTVSVKPGLVTLSDITGLGNVTTPAVSSRDTIAVSVSSTYVSSADLSMTFSLTYRTPEDTAYISESSEAVSSGPNSAIMSVGTSSSAGIFHGSARSQGEGASGRGLSRDTIVGLSPVGTPEIEYHSSLAWTTLPTVDGGTVAILTSSVVDIVSAMVTVVDTAFSTQTVVVEAIPTRIGSITYVVLGQHRTSVSMSNTLPTHAFPHLTPADIPSGVVSGEVLSPSPTGSSPATSVISQMISVASSRSTATYLISGSTVVTALEPVQQQIQSKGSQATVWSVSSRHSVNTSVPDVFEPYLGSADRPLFQSLENLLRINVHRIFSVRLASPTSLNRVCGVAALKSFFISSSTAMYCIML